MRGMPSNLTGKAALEAIAAQILGEEDKGGTFWSGTGHRKKKGEILEPRSVLYRRRSPSPPTSTSTLSSSLSGGAGGGSTCTGDVAAVSENPSQKKEEWLADLPPEISGLAAAGEKFGIGIDDWETMLSDSPPSPRQEQTFLRWIMADIDNQVSSSQPPPLEFDACITGPNFGLLDPVFELEPIGELAGSASSSAGFHQSSRNIDGKNAIFFHPPTGLPFCPNPPTLDNADQSLLDQLFKVAELIESGNFISAHGILARLNHQLPSPIGKPILRSAFYFKEALQFLVTNSSNHYNRTPSLVSQFDVVLKLNAYKAFSEVSPVLHFTNFTITQTLLEELGTADCIHIIDFDIGIGGQWSSFIHELSLRRRLCSSSPRLKITAFVSLCSFHPLELHLTQQNLSHFAADLNVPLEINISSIDSFEIFSASAHCNEAIAVNLPVGSGLSSSFSTVLRLVKQLMPKIVVSVDRGCDRSDLPFSHHFLRAFQSSTLLLDSIDAAGSNVDMANKIERFVLQPGIENCIIGRYRAAEKMLQWRLLFASAGFVPVQFSNFTEMQAECLLKRVQVRGFHVEKRHASLYLYWQRGELVSISAWRC